MGKCNRAMSTLLRKHRSPVSNLEGDDSEMMEEMMDSIDDIDSGVDDAPVDPRWNDLKKIKNQDNNE